MAMTPNLDASASERQLQELARLLKEARRIAVLTGAGMSTESGIPDFRSPGGLYETVGEGIFQRETFLAHPEAFWRAIGPFYQSVLQAQPNAGHQFLAALEQAPWEKEVCVATQNIDILHQKAGSRIVCTLHGTMEKLQCPRCAFQDHSLPFLPVMEKGEAPRCPQCGAILKPAIVFFGEDLPQEDFSRAVHAFQHCDLALVLGTSLQVTPASWLPSERPKNTPLVILNREGTWMDAEATLVLHHSIAQILSSCLSEMQ